MFACTLVCGQTDYIRRGSALPEAFRPLMFARPMSQAELVVGRALAPGEGRAILCSLFHFSSVILVASRLLDLFAQESLHPKARSYQPSSVIASCPSEVWSDPSRALGICPDSRRSTRRRQKEFVRVFPQMTAEASKNSSNEQQKSSVTGLKLGVPRFPDGNLTHQMRFRQPPCGHLGFTGQGSRVFKGIT